MSERDLIERVLRRCTTDAVFRATALHDPVAAIAQIARENGLTIDSSRAEAVAFVPAGTPPPSSSERTTFVLPDPSTPDELDVAQLDQVAGGCTIDSEKHCTICTVDDGMMW